MPTPQIDPKTGERMATGPVQIDPATGERITASDGGSAAAAANPFATLPAHPAVQMDAPVHAMQALHTAKDLGVGLAKSVGNTGNNVGKILIPDAALRAVGAKVPTPEQQASYFAPANTTQAVGKVAGDVGQFFLPGPGEELAAAKLAPYVGRALPAIKIGAAALGSGAVNKAEGGGFGAGAAGGALGAGIGQGIKSVAPLLAETALGVRATDRAYGRTPGEFIINDTKGIHPGDIAQQAQDAVNNTSAKLDQAARISPGTVDLTPARANAASYLRTAKLQNNPDLIRDVGQVGDQLALRQGVAIPSSVPAYEGLALKRGLGELTNYNPNLEQGLGDAAVKSTVNALQPQLSAAIPGYEAFNKVISTASPVAKRAGAADLNAGILQRSVARFARPTGALAGAGIGSYEGAKRGGPEGALIGAGLGLVAPEILANPSVLMGEARTANMAGPALAKLANASALQYFKPKP